MNGWMDGLMDAVTHNNKYFLHTFSYVPPRAGPSGCLVDGWIDGLMDAWTDGRTDGRMDGWMDG